MSRAYRLAYLVSHPIQYQAPLLRRIAEDPDIDLKVFFCSDVSVRQYHDEGFGRTVEWDVPLLEGYDHRFLPGWMTQAPPTVLRPVNYGLAGELRRGGFDALWTHGYLRHYHLLSMLRARLAGVVVLCRAEAWSMSTRRGPLKNAAKRLMYAGLQRICHGWLTIGTANRAYYVANGMAPDTLFPVPYAVDNAYFRQRAAAAAPHREALRAELGLPSGRPVVLFASKFIGRKRPGDLVDAFARIADLPECRRPCLLMVGDGELAATVKARVHELGMTDSVFFPGFRNQSELPALYDLCDLFVLPSVVEPWGLVVNEVMNAARPIIVSDEVGAAQDLVREGENGFVFPAGDVEALADRMRAVLSDPERAARMGAASAGIIARWSFEEDVAGLKQALDHFVGQRRA